MAEVRCPTDNKLAFVTSDDFTGQLGGKCHGRCRADFEYPADAPPTSDRLLCKCGLWVGRGVVQSGYVQSFCRREKVLIRITPSETIYVEEPRDTEWQPPAVRALVPSSPRATPRWAIGLTTEQLLRVMETRWEKFRLERLRAKAEIAIGLRFDVFSRDGFRCRYCGRGPAQGVTLEADHVVPRSAGGPDTMANLVTACWDCNRGKSDKPVDGSTLVA